MNQYDLLAPLRSAEPPVITGGEGAVLFDSEGKRYVDFNELCVILGQNNQAFIDVMSEALRKPTVAKGGSEVKERLHNYLMETTNHQFNHVHLTTSGTEAAEWAVLMAQKLTGRSEVVTFWNSIHGRTKFGAALSGLPARKIGYGPLAPGVVYAPYPNCNDCPMGKCSCDCGGDKGFACLELLDRKYKYESAQDAAAVIVEGYQAAGLCFPPEGYLKALYDWAKSRGMLFIMDEIQSGMGRTGTMYFYQQQGIEPDMLLLGKGLGNGFHIAALLSKDQPEKAALPAMSGGAGEEILACTAACEVFRQLENGLLDHINTVGKQLQDGFAELCKHPSVKNHRGAGLAAGLQLKDPEVAKELNLRLRERGFLMAGGASAVCCRSPYALSAENVSDLLKAMDEILTEIEK